MSTSTDDLKPTAQEVALHKDGRTAAAFKAYRVRLMVDLKTAMKAFADLDKKPEDT